MALDYALQCSPDHPWVTEHPQWFRHRPDGSIRYAENPPKRYQDIFPINFDTEDREALWDALRDVMLFWISHGVRVFRVDNPHTKPIAFWEWLIAEVHGAHPDVLFLAEAFTRPPMMKRLAKVGFTPVVHVLHVAQHQAGARRVPHRAVVDRDGRLLPAQLLGQHAGHPARVPAARRSRPPSACGSSSPR